MRIKIFLLLLSITVASQATATNRTVNLTIHYKTVNFTGKPAEAIVANNQLPGPTLHFKQGDHVTIHVINHLKKGTAIHWHGVLVPWRMDGVAHVTQMPIPSGGVFHYQFTLKQSGTYWYHAHSELQEQQGLYGAFIIDPKEQHLKYTKDFVVILSDWSNIKPKTIYQNLKKDGDYYAPRFPLQASLAQFIRTYQKASASDRRELIAAYRMMQTMRMSPYDISDVAFDAFLLNGHTTQNPWSGKVNVGDTVRLRFINAGGSSIFHVKMPGQMMQLVHAQGNNIKPVILKDFIIAPGETYDVLIKITKDNAYPIYAESIDKVGKTYGSLMTHYNQTFNFAQIKPFPEPKPIMMMQTGIDHDMSSMPNMPSMHMEMSMPKAPLMTADYNAFQALKKTNNPNKPVHIIKMELTGYMGRYIWFLNGLPEYAAKPIQIRHGERYRIIFINNSMMRHPMHIHGHWFILRNGHGAYDPKLHTINVAPNSTVTADFDANTSGQWYFHCHNIYHMQSGMARIISYQTTPEISNGHYLNGHNDTSWYIANRLELGGDFINHNYQATLKSLIGTDNHKFELYTKDAEIDKNTVQFADVDLFYWHPISQFWSIKGGANYTDRPAQTGYWQPGVGIEGLMPLFIDTNLRTYYYSGSEKFDLELSRDTQITRNFLIRIGARGILATKTVPNAMIGSGLNTMEYFVRPFYRVRPGIDLYAQYEHEQFYGAFRNLEVTAGQGFREDIFSVGVSLLF